MPRMSMIIVPRTPTLAARIACRRLVTPVCVAMALTGWHSHLDAAPITVSRGSHYLSSHGGFFDFGPPIGLLHFHGKPFGPGNTDTHYRRMADAVLPNIGDSAAVPIEMVNVGLESEAPLTIGGSLYNVLIGLTPGKHSTGEMVIKRLSTLPAEGTYTTNVHILFTAAFVPIDGGAPIPPATDSIFILSVSPGTWSETPGALFVTVTSGPLEDQTANFFLQGTINMLDPVRFAGGNNNSSQYLAVPTLTLWGRLGLIALLVAGGGVFLNKRKQWAIAAGAHLS